MAIPNVTNMTKIELQTKWLAANQQAHFFNQKKMVTQAKDAIRRGRVFSDELARRSGKRIAVVDTIDATIQPIKNVANAAVDTIKGANTTVKIIAFAAVAYALMTIFRGRGALSKGLSRVVSK